MGEENLSIHSLFQKTAFAYPDNIALQIKEGLLWQRFTFAEVEKSALAVSVFLLKMGLEKGDRAALILENRPEWGIIYLGIVKAGLVCVPIDPALSAQECQNLICVLIPKPPLSPARFLPKKGLLKMLNVYPELLF